MGVDFDSCDDCGISTCDQNITYLDLPGYGSHKTCQVCVKEYFEENDARNDVEVCVHMLNDEDDEDMMTTFYRVHVKDVDMTCRLVSKEKIVHETTDAEEARRWCLEDDSMCVGFYQPWDKPINDELRHVYDPDDKDMPILDATNIYARHYERKHDYSPFNNYREEHIKPKPHWKTKRLRQLEAQIENLQDKRQRIMEL